MSPPKVFKAECLYHGTVDFEYDMALDAWLCTAKWSSDGMGCVSNVPAEEIYLHRESGRVHIGFPTRLDS